jgi:uncharacterized alkaline shock family protein YloU
MTQPNSAAPARPATRISDTSPATTDPMSTDDGKVSVAQGVVQKIAGIACREVSGVHAMGVSTSRAFGAVRERIPGSSGPNVAQGVGVEVGETQAAIDLDIVVEYGVSIADLGRSIQRNVKQAVERMTGLEVVEVNVNVDDLYLPGSDDQDGDAPLWSTASTSMRSPRRPAAARPSMIFARVAGAAWCPICRAGKWPGCG